MRSGTKDKRHFFVTVVLVCFLLSTVILPIPVYAAASQAQEDVSQLLGSMRGPAGAAAQSIKGESARVYFEDGYLRVLGAPANNYFPVNKAVAGSPTVTAKNFITERGAVFGVKSKAVDFVPKKSEGKNSHGYERFQQTYSQIPVFCAEVVIQLNVSGGVEYAFSHIMRKTGELDGGKVSTVPTISAADAEFLAIKLMTQKHPGLQLGSSDANLMIYQPAVVGNSGATRLVWQTVVVSVSVPTVNEFILIDAHTGEVALHYTQIMDALNRQIYDSNNTAADPGTLLRSEGGPATGITDVDTCYNYFRDTYNFYFNEHGRDSIDNAGMKLNGTVRICPYYPDECPYQNAFWDGSRMYFGEGFVADDVTAHELTHGVTQYTSNLIYMNESGAINESFSDMWGEWVDLTNGAGNDSPSVRWLMGEDIPGIGAIRNMANPPQFGDPDRKGSPLWYSGTDDNGGVHTNSGVGNKLCYLLTDGNTFNGKTVTGMGISATADLFYEVQTHLLTSGANYADLHDALTQAAINLGWSAANRANLENACLATELSAVGPLPPANDECVNAICVSDGVPVNGTTIGATGTDITSCGFGDTADVWYSYTPAVSSSVTISLCGSSYDTTLAIFSACGGTELACNDDSSCGLSSQITMSLAAGTTYLIRVSGFGGQKGDFVITVTGGEGACGPRSPVAQTGSASTQFNTSVLITLVATDDGLPNPPGILNYIITSLPSHGVLSDPCADSINSVPYTLAGNGNNVIYTPATGYDGVDNFTFKANDGGVPPDGGDSNTATVSISVINAIYIANMDTDPGWTLDSLWQWGTPTGSGGAAHGNPDPTGGYTGANVVGYNLLGDYENLIASTRWAQTPAIDCTNRTAVTLTFYRWLNVEQPLYDHAYIQDSNDGSTWNTIWQNSSVITDSNWTLQTFDISAIADNQPTVYIRWGMGPTDSSWQFSGWNIDDVKVTGISQLSTLTISSTDGGFTEPNEGGHQYANGTVVDINAIPDSGYYFVNWTGTAADAVKIADSTSAATTVLMDADYTVIANFAVNSTPTRIISLSGDLAFGSVLVGSSPQRILTINNTGSSTMTVSGISYPSGFSGDWSGTIAAGDSQPVTVTFSPTSTTSYGGTVTVNSDKTSGTNTIAASGTGTLTPPTRIISLSGNLAFGSVMVGTSPQRILTISNTGNSTMTISGISYPSGFSGDWSGTIAAGGSQPVTVTFSPTSATSYGGTVTVNSDMTSGTDTIAASGTGTLTPVNYTLTVDSSGASSVSIASSTGHNGITPYDKTVLGGTSVNLQAPRYVGSGASRMSFAGWSGSVTDSELSITFTMDDTKTITANYESDPQIYVKFGSFDAQTNVKRTLKDCSNNDVTFSLSGGGYGEIDPYDCHFGQIELYNTTDKSVLTIKIKSKTETSIGDINVSGPLKTISAANIGLQGNITIGSSTTPNSTAAVTIVLDRANYLAINSQMPIQSISATEWLGGSINAPSIGSITTKGDKKRVIPGDLDVNVTLLNGSINSVKVAGTLSGDWTCNSVKSISATAIIETNLKLSQPPDATILALGSLTAKGWIDSSQILSQGNIGTVTAGAIIDSSCFAGVAEGITGLPAAEAASFSETATIKSITMPYYISSNIAAVNILNASIAYPQSDNGSVPFGVSADNIKKLTIKETNGTTTLLKDLDSSTDSKMIDGVEIRLY